MTTVDHISDEEWDELLAGIAVRPTREVVDWLVPGLIHPGITVVTGQPERGKTTLLTTLCAAAIQGARWLGQPTLLQPDSQVLFLAEDDSSAAQLKRSLAGVDPDRRIIVWRIEQWEDTVNFQPVVTKGNLGLVIVDSAYGAVGDVNDQARANVFVSSLQTIGVPVVVVHHEAKHATSTPAGAQRFRAAYRHTLRIKSLRPFARDLLGLEIEVSGNDVPGKSTLHVALDRKALTAGIAEPAEVRPRRVGTTSRHEQARVLGRLACEAGVDVRLSHTEIATALLGGTRSREEPRHQAKIADALGLPSIGHQALANRIKANRTEFDAGYHEGSGG